MTTITAQASSPIVRRQPALLAFAALAVVGATVFLVQATIAPQRAWQAYLVNFLVFSAIAQGGVLFSTMMHTTGARWSGPLAGLAEAFAAFFPVSFVLFVVLMAGGEYVFPWHHHDLHGKEVWLNLPFLFCRDAAGLLILYGLGFGYLYHALRFKLSLDAPPGRLRDFLRSRWALSDADLSDWRRRMGVFSVLYMLAFAVVLALLGFDLVMAADPHWFSTLFGAYSFVKAIYVGFGALIILAAVLHLAPTIDFQLPERHFHDMGKLFFAFCLVWADFFYCQFVVIWYGNIPEETAYVIARTLLPPWNHLAWTVFCVSFVAPFLILINKDIKTRPKAMIAICAGAIAGIWLEHFLLVGPALHPGVDALPLGVSDVLIALGFFGLMALAVSAFLNAFPELVRAGHKELN